MSRIAIFTTYDYTWAFPTWQQTIALLAKEHDVIGLYLFPEKLGKMQGSAIIRWYFKTLGFGNAALLALFAVCRTLRRMTSDIRTWEQLARVHDLELLHGASPNKAEVVTWVQENEIDVIYIMVPNILKGDILSAPRIGLINKHAAMLPACRGVFPYIWAKIHDIPTGVTFHQVDAGIDTGRILVQREHPPQDTSATRPMSLLRFYTDVYDMYPEMARQALENLVAGQRETPRPDLSESYYSFPTREDIRVFSRKAPIARISDILYNPNSI